MSIETKLEKDLIWITILGAATAAEFAEHAAEMARIEKAGIASPNRFTDLSDNRSLPDFASMYNFAEVRSKAKLKNKVRSAVLAPSDYHYGMARMFQELNSNPQIEVQVFRNKADALKWVGGKT